MTCPRPDDPSTGQGAANRKQTQHGIDLRTVHAKCSCCCRCCCSSTTGTRANVVGLGCMEGRAQPGRQLVCTAEGLGVSK